MSISSYLREIGRGKDGARPLDREQARDLMQRLLDGELSDLEKGAFAIAMRIKGETPQELAGFMDATAPRTLALHAPSTAVVLPSYNGARKLPNLTPLLALMLAREGVPVLLHGFVEDPGRVTTAAVLDALGLPALDSAAAVQARWADGAPAFLPLEVLHPSLAALLSLRRVIGLRNSGHTLAKLLPAVPGALRVVNHTHPGLATELSEFLALTEADALLMRGTEGEPVADARRLPTLRAFLRGRENAALSVAGPGGSLGTVPGAPVAIDAAATAEAIRDMLAGRRVVPAPIERQRDCLLALRRAIAHAPAPPRAAHVAAPASTVNGPDS